MFDLSLVLPTCNHAPSLMKTLLIIERHTHCAYEIIVIDNASTDTTPQVLELAHSVLRHRLRVIREESVITFAAAVNKGLRAASGHNLAWLTDTACPADGTLDNAIDQLDRSAIDIGMLAIPHSGDVATAAMQSKQLGKTYSISHARGTLIADFGIGRTRTFASLGYLDEQSPAAIADLSMKVWHGGLEIIAAKDARIDVESIEAVSSPAEALLAKWNLPAVGTAFDATKPCTLRGARKTALAA